MKHEATNARQDTPGAHLSTADLKADIANELRLTTRDPDAKASHNRRAAELIVTLRERFLTPTGHPDLLGEFRPYRRALKEVYKDAGVQSGDRPRVQSALRYHIGNILRERYDDETLETLGLKSGSPAEWSRERKASAADELQVSRMTGASNAELRTTIDGLVETIDLMREELEGLREEREHRNTG